MPSDDAIDLIRDLNMGYTPTDKRQCADEDSLGSGKYKNASKSSFLLQYLPKFLCTFSQYLDIPSLCP